MGNYCQLNSQVTQTIARGRTAGPDLNVGYVGSVPKGMGRGRRSRRPSRESTEPSYGEEEKRRNGMGRGGDFGGEGEEEAAGEKREVRR